MPKDLNLAKIPVAKVLFSRWRDTRGNAVGNAKTFVKPFGLRWEELRGESGLISAVDDEHALADLQYLANAGLVERHFDRRHRLIRITIPFAAEPSWCENFEWTRPQPNLNDAPKFRAHPWQPELDFCKNETRLIPLNDALAIDNFLKNGGGNRPIVPIKERSLEIFGDEKRLDYLAKKNTNSSEDDDDNAATTKALCGGRLPLAALRCRIVPEPFAWLPGACPTGPVLILENVATFATFRRWDKEIHPTFFAFIYGCGYRFLKNELLSLSGFFAETGGPRPVFYFGDLDPDGLRIPRVASERARANNLPAIRPLLWAYQALIQKIQRPNTETKPQRTATEADLNWLEHPDLTATARALFAQNHRIPQEALGYEHLTVAPNPASPKCGY